MTSDKPEKTDTSQKTPAASGQPKETGAATRPEADQRQAAPAFLVPALICVVTMVALLIFGGRALLLTLGEINNALAKQNEIADRLMRRLSVVESFDSRLKALEARIDSVRTSADPSAPGIENSMKDLRKELDSKLDAAAAENSDARRETLARMVKLEERLDSLYTDLYHRIMALETRPGETEPPSSTLSAPASDTGTAPRSSAPGRLYVNTAPRSAQVLILNSKKDFSQGVRLDPGRYQLEISTSGYETERTWVTVSPGHDAKVEVSLLPVH